MANRLFLFCFWVLFSFLNQENPLFHQQCNANDLTNSMLIGHAFCRLLPISHLLHWKFCWFWLFLCDFHFLDNQGHPKRSPQQVRDKWRALNRAILNHPDQLATHILKPTTGKDLPVTRLMCNGGVNFRNQYNCWSQWPTRCSQLWSHIFLVWTWISWKFIDHRRRISNGWVLSPKKSLLCQHSSSSSIP